jgi:hypothetical protein
MTKAEKYHVEQLQRAVEITRMDLDALTPDGYVELQEQLFEFIYGAGSERVKQSMLVVGPVETLREELLKTMADKQRPMVPDESLRPIVESIKKTIAGIARSQGGFILVTKVTKAELTATVDNKSSPFVLRWSINPEEGARLALFLHLEGSGLSLDRFRYCARKGCNNIFVLASYARADHKHYCSKACSRYAAVLKYRQGKAEEEKKKLEKKRSKKQKKK